MANSLRAKISKLRHDGNISDSEYQELIKKLDGHDAKVREDAIKTIDEELKEVRHCLVLAKEQMLIDYVYIACEHLDNIEKLKEQNSK